MVLVLVTVVVWVWVVLRREAEEAGEREGVVVSEGEEEGEWEAEGVPEGPGMVGAPEVEGREVRETCPGPRLTVVPRVPLGE